MAVSTIPKTNKYVDITIHVGTSQYDGFYFNDVNSYNSSNVISAQVISVTDNHWATVTIMGFGIRAWVVEANKDVTIRLLLK